MTPTQTHAAQSRMHWQSMRARAVSDLEGRIRGLRSEVDEINAAIDAVLASSARKVE